MKIIEKLKTLCGSDEVHLTCVRKIPRTTRKATLDVRSHCHSPGLHARHTAELLFFMGGVAEFERLHDFLCDVSHLERWFKDAMRSDEPSSVWWYGGGGRFGYTDLTIHDPHRCEDYYCVTYDGPASLITVELVEGRQDGW